MTELIFSAFFQCYVSKEVIFFPFWNASLEVNTTPVDRVHPAFLVLREYLFGTCLFFNLTSSLVSLLISFPYQQPLSAAAVESSKSFL